MYQKGQGSPWPFSLKNVKFMLDKSERMMYYMQVGKS